MIRSIGLVALFGAAVAAHAFTPDATLDPEQTALRINQSGFICSEIASATRGMTDSLWTVRCIEFHDGTGRAHFAVDTVSGLVMQTY